MLHPYFADTLIDAGTMKYSKQFTTFDDFAVQLMYILSFENVYIQLNSTPQIHRVAMSLIFRMGTVSVFTSNTVPPASLALIHNLYT